MSGSLPAFNQFYGLSNLTAPANGTTHAAKWTVVIPGGGGSVILSMSSQMSILGDFQAQAMTVDNSANALPLTVQETTFGWQRIVPAGSIQTFQYPGVKSQSFTFTGSNAMSVPVSYYDWPAFPDSVLNAATGGVPVTIGGTVAVAQASVPWQIMGTGPAVPGTAQTGSLLGAGIYNAAIPAPANGQQAPLQLDAQARLITSGGTLTAAGNAAHSIVTGGTAVTVFTAGSVLNAGYVINPPSATESLFIDIVNVAGTVAGGTSGTTIEIPAGQAFIVPGPLAGTVSANAVTSGHGFTAFRL